MLGGNLAISLCLKAASYGVRLPDGILTSYAPFMVHFRPSPSRLLSLLDPLLPVGILTQCLAAYTGTTTKGKTDDAEKRQTQDNEKSDQSSSEVSCCCENDRLLPDVVKDSQAASGQIPQTSSALEIAHSQSDHVLPARSQSDGTLPNCSDTHTEEIDIFSPCGLLNDDHLNKMAKNPYLSPLLASNEQLSMLPSVDLVVSCFYSHLFDR